MKIRKDYTCPLEIVHDLTKGKWKPIIMFQLRNGEVSLADLERRIEGISQKMLIEQLNELVAYGIVKKKKYEGYPLRVGYSLTDDRGHKMLEAILIMQDIGIDYMKNNGMEDVLKEKGII
jgi:DNA-binding HxlR family transcriptional regulator